MTQWLSPRRALPAVVTVGLLSSPVPAAGQSGTNLQRPPTWKARYDDGAAGRDRRYEVMRPGWHVHPGPAGVFWDPGRFADGNYGVTSTIFLFPAGSGDPPARVDAPYGLLLAGENLDGRLPAYVTFMLSNQGRFRVARHQATEVRSIVPWTAHDAIVTLSPGASDTAENDLAVDVTETTVTFWINDVQVASVARENLPTRGVIGLRAGDHLSLHVSSIEIGPNRR